MTGSSRRSLLKNIGLGSVAVATPTLALATYAYPRPRAKPLKRWDGKICIGGTDWNSLIDRINELSNQMEQK